MSANDPPSNRGLKVDLVCDAGGDRGVSVYASAEITGDGRLQLSGQDLGEGASPGGDESEYFATIEARDKDRLLVAFLELHYAGETRPAQALATLAAAKGIPVQREKGKPSRKAIGKIGWNGCLRVAERDAEPHTAPLVTVLQPGEKDRLLLALVEAIFAADCGAVKNFAQFAKSKGIEVGWFRWP